MESIVASLLIILTVLLPIHGLLFIGIRNDRIRKARILRSLRKTSSIQRYIVR